MHSYTFNLRSYPCVFNNSLIVIWINAERWKYDRKEIQHLYDYLSLELHFT